MMLMSKHSPRVERDSGVKGDTHEMTMPANLCPTESSRIMPKCMRRFPEQRFGSQCSRSQHAARNGGLWEAGSPSSVGWE